MIKNNENRNEILLTTIFIGLFLLLITAFSNQSISSDSELTNQNSIVVEISVVESIAINTTPTNFPDFNKSWVTSDKSNIKYNYNIKLLELLSNNRANLEFNTNTASYLSFKLKTLASLKSHHIFPQISVELPPIS